MLLTIHILLSALSITTAIAAFLKQNSITKFIAKPSFILVSTSGSIATGFLLVATGSSVIRVCSLGLIVSVVAVLSIIKSIRKNDLVFDL